MGVYLAESAGLPMRSVASAVAAVGQGLLGDRYQTGRGEWSYHPRLFDDVTLIGVEALDAARKEHGVQLAAGTARRNVEVRGSTWPPWSVAASGLLRSCCGGNARASRAATSTGSPARRPGPRWKDGVACGRRSLSGGRLNVGDSIGVNRPVAPVPPHGAFTARSDD